MRIKTIIVATASFALFSGAAQAQIGLPGITLPAPPATAPAVTQPPPSAAKPGVVTLHDAAQDGGDASKSAPGNSTAGQKEATRQNQPNPIAIAANAAQSPAGPSPFGVSAPGAVLPLPMPIPSVSALAIRPRPDITLVRISIRGGVQRATLFVKGATRSGLTVGDKVLKQVLSEFRDDGVCLDSSLHKPKCATFIPFAYD